MKNDLGLSLNDFGAAKMLMELIVEAGKHGPLYQRLASAAGQELKAMMQFEEKTPRVITPAAGPENSIRINEDGTETDLSQEQQEQARRDTQERLQKEYEARRQAAAEPRDLSGKPVDLPERTHPAPSSPVRRDFSENNDGA